MFNTMHYTLRTTSMTGTLTNAVATYDVFFDAARGIAYEVVLQAPPIFIEEAAQLPPASEAAQAVAGLPATGIAPQPLLTWWNAKIVQYVGDKRLEYDMLKRIYYQTRQTIQVESALFKLQEDVTKFLEAGATRVEPFVSGGVSYPGYRLYTLTIWIDPQTRLPVRRVNMDRGYAIIDEFSYHSLNQPLPPEVFQLPKPAEAIADFDLYPDLPTLPRFEVVEDADNPQYGIWVQTLMEEIKRHTILNQWEYGPFATIDLPWLTPLTVEIYRARMENVFPPIVVAVNAPMYPTNFFLISYDFLGYVVAGHTDEQDYDLSQYERLPIEATMMLEDLVPLYQSPSFEKQFVINNFVTSVQANDFFINAFNMGGQSFDLVIKNFSFHENEGYLLLNVYGKEYWDNANMEAMFNFIVTGRMVDAHTTPITIYALNVMKRLGIYVRILMPVYEEIPVPEPPVIVEGATGLGTM